MIEFHDVCVCYEPQKRHPVQSLDGLNLKIEEGDWVFLVGPSGAGKSSLLKLIFAGTRAQSGRITVDGEDITHISHREVPNLRRKIGIVFQDFQLLNEKTAWENVAFTLRVIGTPQSVIVREVPRALETVGLTHRAEAYPHELSGGEQQRIAIARAIVNDPKILLADEPTGNLDPQTAKEVGELLTKINRERGTTIVMATHDRLFVDTLARRVVRLNAGKVVKDENPGTYGESDGYGDLSALRNSSAPAPQAQPDIVAPAPFPAPLVNENETKAEEVRAAEAKARQIREDEERAKAAKEAEGRAAEFRAQAEAIEAEIKAAEARAAEAKAREERMAQRRAAEAREAEARAAEERAAQAKAALARAAEAKAAEEKAAQAREAERRAAEIRAEEVRIAEARAAEIRAAEAKAAREREEEREAAERARQAREERARAAEREAAAAEAARVKAAETRETELKAAEDRAREARLAERREAEARAAEIRAAEAKAAQEAQEAQERLWQQSLAAQPPSPQPSVPSYNPPIPRETVRETPRVIASEPEPLEYSAFDRMLEETVREAENPPSPPQFVPTANSWVTGNDSPDAYDSYDLPMTRPMARRIAPAETPPPPPSGHPLDPNSFVSDPEAPLGSPENPIVQYE